MAQATVRYALSKDGQRAALAQNLDPQAEQRATVPVVNGDLALFEIARDGTLSADARQGYERQWGDWRDYWFDSPPTADDLLVFLRLRKIKRAEVVSAEQAAAAAKEAERRQRESSLLQAALDAIATADAAGATEVPGYVVNETSISGQGAQVAESQNEHVAAICARRRAARQAMDERAARIKRLPQMPQDYPVSIVSPGMYASDVPSTLYSEAWAKHVTNVNTAQRGGYALNGEWLRDRTTRAVGDIVVVGSKAWEGSRRSGGYVHDVAIYVMTPASLCRVWRGSSTDTAVSRCSELLEQSSAERATAALASRIATCDKQLSALAGLDREAYQNEMDEVAKRRDAWQALRDRLQAALDGEAADDKVVDIDSAAAAIVAAGYRMLAQEHHPDHGGSTETMALLNEAKRQLRELLRLAAEVQQ